MCLIHFLKDNEHVYENYRPNELMYFNFLIRTLVRKPTKKKLINELNSYIYDIHFLGVV